MVPFDDPHAPETIQVVVVGFSSTLSFNRQLIAILDWALFQEIDHYP